MIELEQIKKTDTIKQLRGQLNTTFSEIVTDQPMIGRVVNPSANLYGDDGNLLGTVTAANMMNGLTVTAFPESNGVFVAGIGGMLGFAEKPANWTYACIDIPAIKLPTRTASVSTYVPPTQLGLPNVYDFVPAKIALLMSKASSAVQPPHVFVGTVDETSLILCAWVEQGDNVCNLWLMANVFPS